MPCGATIETDRKIDPPPVGMTLFVIRAQQPNLPIPTLYRGIVPSLAPDGALVLLLFLLRGTALWLPGMLFR